ncbi:MAG: hypothetical protein A2Z07_07330 [Armatimonadetes bacterium RBG_16_67_12]|nr:MAG: hypothetical protein A2Z07_07330 [Armatimonadetes bacterium RBG_16_67_12]
MSGLLDHVGCHAIRWMRPRICRKRALVKEVRSHLVQTRPAHGLQPSDVARAVALLSEEQR